MAAERKPRTIWLSGDETRKALADVADERIKQHQKWGTQRHDFPVWLAVLAEEVGELAQEVLRYRERSGELYPNPTRLREMRAEAIQVAAVAVAMIEHIDSILDGGRDESS